MCMLTTATLRVHCRRLAHTRWARHFSFAGHLCHNLETHAIISKDNPHARKLLQVGLLCSVVCCRNVSSRACCNLSVILPEIGSSGKHRILLSTAQWRCLGQNRNLWLRAARGSPSRGAGGPSSIKQRLRLATGTRYGLG